MKKSVLPSRDEGIFHKTIGIDDEHVSGAINGSSIVRGRLTWKITFCPTN